MITPGRLLSAVAILLFLGTVVAPPPRRPATPEHKPNTEDDLDINSETMGLEYKNYLEEVVRLLEDDPKFKTILENATDAEIKSGSVADKLHVVDPRVRSKLDELKRIELQRLRKAATEQFELSHGLDRSNIKEPAHLEHTNPHTFREEDLRKLVKATAHDLAQLDKDRRAEFKKHEMEKEYNYQRELKKMDEQHKQDAIKKHEQDKAKSKQHEKVHHPLSEDQLEEVWERQDHMDKDNFDPETFFRMHDVDGNEVLDANEVMALFKPELDKIYTGSDFDPAERDEEMEEMREAAFDEADTDKDGLISLKEFLDSSMHEDFKHDQGWDAIPDRDIYDSEEFDRFTHDQDELSHEEPDSSESAHDEAPHQGQADSQHSVPAPAAGHPPAHQDQATAQAAHPGQAPAQQGQAPVQQAPVQAHQGQPPPGQHVPVQGHQGQAPPAQQAAPAAQPAHH